MPAVCQKFHAEILPCLALPQLSQALLLAFRSKDIKAERIARVIQANPYYLDALRRRWISQSSNPDRETDPTPEQLLVQLGMEGSRNWLLANQAVRSATGTHPEWGDRGQTVLEPSVILRRSIAAEKTAGLIAGENPAIAFSGALVFDLLAQLPATSELKAYSDRVFEQGLKGGQIAAALGRKLPELRSRRYLFGAALLEAAGRLLLARVEPGVIRFEQRCEEKGLPRPLYEFALRQRFGTNSSYFSAMACKALGVFKSSERALLFSEQPYLLRSDPKAVYQFSAVLRLASNMALRLKRVELETDSQLKTWKGLELRELPVEAQALIAISRMMLG